MSETMPSELPPYDSYIENRDSPVATKTGRTIGIKVVRTLEDMAQVIAIRSAVYLSEQQCPFWEEFDGNDFCAAHFLAYQGREPVGCIRARFFSGFTKLERLAVRHEFRKTRAAFNLVNAGIEFARKKGYKLIYGHSQDRLQDFWAHFGAKPLNKNHKLVFSDFSYTEMVIELEPHSEPITINSDPYEIIRPEGAWHRPGVLDSSAKRPATSPQRNLEAA
jgi:predicted GNAT family N-acyltransferase